MELIRNSRYFLWCLNCSRKHSCAVPLCSLSVEVRFVLCEGRDRGRQATSHVKQGALLGGAVSPILAPKFHFSFNLASEWCRVLWHRGPQCSAELVLGVFAAIPLQQKFKSWMCKAVCIWKAASFLWGSSETTLPCLGFTLTSVRVQLLIQTMKGQDLSVQAGKLPPLLTLLPWCLLQGEGKRGSSKTNPKTFHYFSMVKSFRCDRVREMFPERPVLDCCFDLTGSTAQGKLFEGLTERKMINHRRLQGW